MQKRPTTIPTETEGQQYDDETRYCRNVWFEVLNRAIDDVEIERRRMGAFSFFCSSDCEQLCATLSLDVEALRAKFVPADFRAEYERQMIRRASTVARPEATAALGAIGTQAKPVMPTQSLAIVYARHTFDSRSISQCL
jgi:hypothetical protein